MKLTKIYRSKAPLRLGLAGGGTDVAPYSNEFGGSILNATINMYAWATIVPNKENTIRFFAEDKEIQKTFTSTPLLETNHELGLIAGIYNRIVKNFCDNKALSFDLYTSVDAPAGSGLGTSSTLVTAIVGAFVEWLKLPLGEYDIAKLAYDIERVDMAMSGGKQDQYAATFGGVNFMEFKKDDTVIVNPLRIKSEILHELAYNLVLFYTNTSRESAKIIDQQRKNVEQKATDSISAMHELKKYSADMKELLLRGDLHHFGELLDKSWQSKKRMATNISNPKIDDLYTKAINAGATGGKISGAGGGGFMFFWCPGNTKPKVIKALKDLDAILKRYEFVVEGLKSWSSTTHF